MNGLKVNGLLQQVRGSCTFSELCMMYIDLKGRNKEVANIATFVAVLGGLKVFTLDLFGIKGVPLVLSVYSFGMVAAFGSVVMEKWQKKRRKQLSCLHLT